MKLFEREIRVWLKGADGGFTINAVLKDTHHDMTVELLIDHPSMEITGVSARIDRAPYAICQKGLERMETLVGLMVKPGINRQVKELIGGTKGCVHIVELLQECFKGALQGKISLVVGGLAGDDQTKKLEEMLKGQCLRYTEENTSMDLLA